MTATEAVIRTSQVTGYYNYAGLAKDVLADIGEYVTNCGSKTILVIVGGYKMLKRWHNHPYRQETESGIIDADFYVNAYPSDTNSHLEPSIDDSALGFVVGQTIERVRKRTDGAVVLVLGLEDPIHVSVLIADVAKKCWCVQYRPEKGTEHAQPSQDNEDAARMAAEGGPPLKND